MEISQDGARLQPFVIIVISAMIAAAIAAHALLLEHAHDGLEHVGDGLGVASRALLVDGLPLGGDLVRDVLVQVLIGGVGVGPVDLERVMLRVLVTASSFLMPASVLMTVASVASSMVTFMFFVLMLLLGAAKVVKMVAKASTPSKVAEAMMASVASMVAESPASKLVMASEAVVASSVASMVVMVVMFLPLVGVPAALQPRLVDVVVDLVGLVADDDDGDPAEVAAFVDL